MVIPLRTSLVAALMVAAAMAACNSENTRNGDPALARAKVREAVERYVAVSRTVNADSIAAFFAPNGVLFEPGIAPIQSADSIRRFMASFPGVLVESASVVLDTIELHDSTAYVWGNYFERLSFPGQPRSEQRGRFVMQWLRFSDAWHLLRYYRIPVTTIVPPSPAVP